jgi:hypothetical protein
MPVSTCDIQPVAWEFDFIFRPSAPCVDFGWTLPCRHRHRAACRRIFDGVIHQVQHYLMKSIVIREKEGALGNS